MESGLLLHTLGEAAQGNIFRKIEGFKQRLIEV